MDAVVLLQALRTAAPHCIPSLTLDGNKLRICLHDQKRGTNFSGTLDAADMSRMAADIAAEMAREERR